MATCKKCFHFAVCIIREKSISLDPMKCGYKCPDFKNNADIIEAKTGSWEEIKTGDGLYDYRFKCPECKHLTIKGYVVAPDFCPGCGADMRGGKNG